MLLDKLRTIKLRPKIFTIHSWIGLIVGIFIAIMGLTGSGIVFMHELDHTLNPALMHITPQGQLLAIDLIIAPVIRSHPNLAIDSIELPHPFRIWTAHGLSGARDPDPLRHYQRRGSELAAGESDAYSERLF